MTAFGHELVQVHNLLRDALRRVRAEAEASVASAERLRSLRLHCMSFCSALTRHHESEDARAFPLIADQFPELAPVIEKLEQDHEMVATILSGVEAKVVELGDAPDAAARRRFEMELDGLTAIMESHFAFEERQIVAALNSLDGVDVTTYDMFGINTAGMNTAGIDTAGVDPHTIAPATEGESNR